MPKIKTPKSKGSKWSRGTKSKTASRSKAGLPSLDELIHLPDEFELARGPILRVKFPKVDEDDEDDDEPLEVPHTMEELRKLYKPYAKMEVVDDAGEVMFDGALQVRDFVQIRAGEVGGQSVEDSERWFAQITYIGARYPSNKQTGQGEEKEQPDVCLRVAWFYDHGMLDQRTLPAEDKRSCSNMIPNELIFSDHSDTVHLSSLLAAADITYYDESSTSQAPIGPDDLFYRRTICQDRIISLKNGCMFKCRSGYKPDRDIQHFCCRLSCKRWFHATCLEPTKTRPNDYRLEYHLPSEEQQLVDLVSLRAPRGKASNKSKSKSAKSKFGSVGASSETEAETVTSPDTESQSLVQRRLALARNLPAQVRALAMSSIVRGIDSGQGIVGGAYPVLQARWLARKVIIDGGVLTQQEENDLMDAATAANPDGGLKVIPRKYVCPGCENPI